ncbi:MAG: 1-acyl-sn-glycerol-3-phosphate acyltransferase [Saprospiraceae bacterium]
MKGLVWIVLRLFFKNIFFKNREALRFKEACLLVSNHPNTLLDPLIPAEFARKQVFFLANAGLFAGAFQNWFFSTFYCIPVYRPQDKGYNSGKNKGSFEKAENHLLKDGCLYVAPEGTSYIERRLRTMKTGTARIALQTLERSEFKKDIFILPVGLNYEDQTRFWKSIFVNVGDPIQSKDYALQYKDDPIAAVKSMTDEMEQRLKELTISIDDVIENRIFRQWEQIWSNANGLNLASQFEYSKRMLEKWHENEKLRKMVVSYHVGRRALGLNDRVVDGKFTLFQSGLINLLLTPVALWGVINNIIPAVVVRFIADKLKIYIGYRSAVLTVSGLVIFPLFYWIQQWLVGIFFGSEISGWLYLLAGLISGVFSREWLDRNLLIKDALKIKIFENRFPERISQLQNLRKEILSTSVRLFS